MKLFAIVPVKKFENAKSRLSSVLSQEDRIGLCELMLRETLRKLAATSPPLATVVVVASDERARKIAEAAGAVFLHQELDAGVNSAVSLGDAYATDRSADATLVVPLDLPLLDARDVSDFCGLADGEERCVIICPSQRYDGTNLLLRKPPNVITTFFDRNSYENHLAAARDRSVAVKVSSTNKCSVDVDTPADLNQLLDEKALEQNLVVEFLKRKGVQAGT
jgi:2-phospho-L-lactate guanylyltransferase